MSLFLYLGRYLCVLENHSSANFDRLLICIKIGYSTQEQNKDSLSGAFLL